MITKLKPYLADTHSSMPVPRTRQAGAWYYVESVKIGYEINFNRYFYKPKALRSPGEIHRYLLKLQEQSKELPKKLLEVNNSYA